MAMHYELWYHRTWGTLHITLGILFGLIFVIGAVVLRDPFLAVYFLAAPGLIVMGWMRLKKPYVVFTERFPGSNDVKGEIRVNGLFGGVQQTYTYREPSEIVAKNNRLYQNGRKLRFNSWFINRHQWKKMYRYYGEDLSPADELQDL